MHLRSHLLINNCDRLRTLRQLEAVWDLTSAASHFSESVSPPRFKRSDGNLMFERFLGTAGLQIFRPLRDPAH